MDVWDRKRENMDMVTCVIVNSHHSLSLAKVCDGTYHSLTKTMTNFINGSMHHTFTLHTRPFTRSHLKDRVD